MRRRDFITLVSGAAIAYPLAAQEQRPVIGFLSATSIEAYVPGVAAAFLQGLRDSGFVEGQNIVIEYQGAEGHYDRLPSLAAELVNRQVAVIVCGETPAAFAAKAATK